MAEIVNLKSKRKEKARRERESEAQGNRLRFGRTKAEKVAYKKNEARERQALNGKRLAPETPDEE